MLGPQHLELGVVGRVPANRRVVVRRQTVHVFLGQLEVEQLSVLDNPRFSNGLGQRNESLNR